MRRAPQPLLLLYVLVAPCNSWILYSQDVFGASLTTIRNQMSGQPNMYAPQAQLGQLWSMEGYTTGPTWSAAGGITWAWDPALCEPLMARFSEKLAWLPLVTCDDAKAAVDRAFNKWAGNNRNLKFDDVTAECDKLPEGGRGGPLTSARGDLATFPYHQGCKYAEIYVSFLQDDEIIETAVQVAVARTYGMNVAGSPNASMTFTNLEMPYILKNDGTRDYKNAPFYTTYAPFIPPLATALVCHTLTTHMSWHHAAGTPARSNLT